MVMMDDECIEYIEILRNAKLAKKSRAVNRPKLEQ